MSSVARFLGMSIKKKKSMPSEYPPKKKKKILEEQVLNDEVDKIWVWFRLENKVLQGYNLAP